MPVDSYAAAGRQVEFPRPGAPPTVASLSAVERPCWQVRPKARGWPWCSSRPDELVLGPFTGHNGWVDAVAVGVRYGQPGIVCGGNDRTVRVWDLESERHATLRVELQHRVLAVASAADGSFCGSIFCGGPSGSESADSRRNEPLGGPGWPLL